MLSCNFCNHVFLAQSWAVTSDTPINFSTDTIVITATLVLRSALQDQKNEPDDSDTLPNFSPT